MSATLSQVHAAANTLAKNSKLTQVAGFTPPNFVNGVLVPLETVPAPTGVDSGTATNIETKTVTDIADTSQDISRYLFDVSVGDLLDASVDSHALVSDSKAVAADLALFLGGTYVYTASGWTLVDASDGSIQASSPPPVGEVGDIGRAPAGFTAPIPSSGAINLGTDSVGTLDIAHGPWTLTGSATLESLNNFGTVTASGGTLVITGAVSGAGTLDVDSGATIELEATVKGPGFYAIDTNGALTIDAAVDKISVISFNPTATGATPTDYSTTLVLKDPQAFSGTVEGFTQGDTIDLPNYQATSTSTRATYSAHTLSVPGLGALSLIGSDPVPTIGFKSDGHGGTDLETVNVQTLLDLSMATYNAPYVEKDGYAMLKSATPDAGFEAVAYKDSNSADSDPSIVVAFRGTFPGAIQSFIKNWIADLSSFPTGIASALLQRYVKDAASFVQSVVTDNPHAQITLTGHSLGGALAQLVGTASGLPTAAFNAPGAAQLYASLHDELDVVANLGNGGTDINFRVTGDQISLAGTPLGQTYSIPSIVDTTASTPFVQTLLAIGMNHSSFFDLQTPANYTEGFTGPNYVSRIQTFLQSTTPGSIISINLNVLAGLLNTYPIDPGAGSTFLVAANAGSPAISSIALPYEQGVASYDVAYQIGATFSTFTDVQPGVADDLPADVNAIKFEPLDALGQPVTMSAGFFFSLTFGSSGAFSATLTESGGASSGAPITAPVSITIDLNSNPTPLNIPTPTDPSDSNPADFASLVTALPSDATVTLADGTTPVTMNEDLTTAELTSLEVKPDAGKAGTSSAFTYTVTDAQFASADGTANISVACFGAGTRIATARGAVAVDDLAVGDMLLLAHGGTAPVVWLGHRQVHCCRHPGPLDVWPIRITPGSAAPGSPSCDLLLSPDHAMFIDGVLIPVRYLINGRTIVQEPVDKVTYYHVELPTHAVILAEGLPCESYLDTGNRGAFANGGGAGDGEGAAPTMLHPDFALKVWATQACAELVVDGPKLAAAKRVVLARAEALGHRVTGDPGLGVIVDGRTVPTRITGKTWRVALPPDAQRVRLVSRTWVPAHALADKDDTRSLGAAIANVRLDGRTLTLDDPRFASGWHAPEPHGRWTDGDGALQVAGARELAFDVVMTGSYWQAPAPSDQARANYR